MPYLSPFDLQSIPFFPPRSEPGGQGGMGLESGISNPSIYFLIEYYLDHKLEFAEIDLNFH